MAPSIAQRLCVIFLAAVSLHHPSSQCNVQAAALPELANLALLQPATHVDAIEKRGSWDPDCTDTPASAPTVAAQGSSDNGAVTVTVTVFIPATTSRTSTSTGGNASVSTTSGTRTVSASNASPTSAQTSASNPTQTPSVVAGQQAQQLNIAYLGLQATDSCTAGQRACINNMLAECVASNGDAAKWVTRACPVTPSNEGMTCAAVPFVSSPSPSTTSSAPSSTSTGLAGYDPIPLSDSVAIGCFAKENIAQRFASAGVDGTSGGMFPSGFGSGNNALGRLQFRIEGTVGLALIAGLMLW